MRRPVIQSRLITLVQWVQVAPTCRVDLLLREAERLKWCAGDQIRNAAVVNGDVLNAGDWKLYLVCGGHGACATTLLNDVNSHQMTFDSIVLLLE